MRAWVLFYAAKNAPYMFDTIIPRSREKVPVAYACLEAPPPITHR